MDSLFCWDHIPWFLQSIKTIHMSLLQILKKKEWYEAKDYLEINILQKINSWIFYPNLWVRILNWIAPTRKAMVANWEHAIAVKFYFSDTFVGENT